jgi:large subunit ribosomal protein L24
VRVKIRKGDTVLVINGRRKDKGKRGEVIKVLPDQHRVVVQGINLRKKHQKQVQTQGRTMAPGIIEFEGSIDISNIMLICPKCKKPTRVGIRHEDGEVQRVCKKCNGVFD